MKKVIVTFRLIAGYACFSFLFLIFGCSHKDNASCDTYYPLLQTFFEIKLKGHLLSRDTLTQVKLSYFSNGVKTYHPIYFPDSTFLPGTSDSVVLTGICVSYQLPNLSKDSSIKLYYLEYPFNLPSDTIYVDYRNPTPASYCKMIVNPIEINNQLAVGDSALAIKYDIFPYFINKP